MHSTDVESDFHRAIVAAGLGTSARVVPDGKLRRFHVKGDTRHAKNGWAVLFADPPAGAFGCWKRGLNVRWSGNGAAVLDPAERARIEERIRTAREQREIEDGRRRDKAAGRAASVWERARPADWDHPYLERKAVQSHGIRQSGARLVVPVRDITGALRGLQRIDGDGRKRFTAGTSKSGNFHRIGEKPTERLYVVEGYATGATVHEATGDCVAVAFDAGNLLPVAEALSAKFPQIDIIIASDNDHATEGNPGRTAAMNAARVVGGLVAVPGLSDGEGTDFNDLAAVQGLAAVREELTQARAPGPPEWPEAPEVPGTSDPEPLPLDALPSVLRDHVRSTAAAIQVPEDVVALLCLLCTSAGVGGKYQIAVDGSWLFEWSPIYGVAVLATGERKSPTFAEMVRPISEWEAERVADTLPRYRAAVDVLEVRERELDKAKRDAANGKGSLDDVEIARFAVEDARKAVPTLPRLLVSDATPEALIRRMAENEGRAALLSPEGDPLRIADGRYSDGAARLDELKKAWSCETLAPDRISREAAHVRRPALTLGLTLQPSVLGDLSNAQSMRNEGVFARMLFVRPPSLVGSRVHSGAAPSLDLAAAHRYRNALRVLLDAEPAGYEADGTPVPHTLTVDGPALRVLYAYTDELEAEKRPGQRLVGIQDWAEKAHGQAVRVAALLELVGRAATGQALFSEPVAVTSMAAAVRLMRAFTTHALTVFGELGTDQRTADLQYIVKRLRELPEGATLRDLHLATRGRKSIDKVDDVRDLVGELAELGCLRLLERASTGGRPPSPVIELHPALLGSRLQKSHKQQGATVGWASVTSVRTELGTSEQLGEDDRAYLEGEGEGIRLGEGAPTEVAELLGEPVSTQCCTRCGTSIGPTAELCAKCRYGIDQGVTC